MSKRDMSRREDDHASNASSSRGLTASGSMLPAATAPAPRFRMLGSLHEFRPESEGFSTYMERVEIYFAVNNVPKVKKVPVLQNAIGGTTYEVLCSLLAPDSPMSTSLADIEIKLRDHFDPKPSSIAERFKFHKQNQNASESIATYIAELRRFTARCSFPCDYLEDTLTDRFLCGLQSEAIQKQLLAEKDLTMASAFEKAQTLETAQKNAQVLKGQVPSLAVGQVSKHPPASRTDQSGGGRNSASRDAQTASCHRCGDRGYTGWDCNFREATWHKCGKLGHLAKVCRSGRGGKQRQVDRNPTRVRTVQSDRGEAADNLLCNVYTLGSGRSKPYRVVLQLNKQSVTLEIDTGAAVSILPERLRKQLFPNIRPKRTEVRLRTYTSKPIPVLGQICVPARYQEYEGTHTFYVVESEGPALLGRDLLSHIKLDWCSIKSVVTGEPQHTLEKLLEKYGEVFQPGLGVMTRIKAHLTLKTGKRPIFRRSHSVPFAIRDKLGRELDRLKEQGVLQRVDNSEWAAPIVPVPKKDGYVGIARSP